MCMEDEKLKTSALAHGGKRKGAGRKSGSGKFGEPTKVIRVPESKVERVKAWLEEGGDVSADDNVHYMALPQFKNAQVFRPDFTSHYDIGLYSHKVVAGFPSPADDNLEQTIDLNTHFIKKPNTTFLVKVQGDSMKQAGIYPGDLLAVDRSETPKDGKIVIASIDGELTVKRLSIKSTGTWLMPENDQYDPIPVRESSDLVIWGVVVSVLRSV
ncbi:translesion error-prone DNA polymerase V autoproteolytic subunit [Thiomicrospira sp. R3]|uniref:LexA family protein n=1 Tax=Thiomicrospira sp. R3 TaxID=3035472 RepID=UPI00259BDF50|nr:translesion error-prone DNA polymerase V autoproteolytic subunit [Thiomicrospira sp. R3]WFE68933.1 translesion error-prone DNA polymerase V autoproteolytic subunit [Thiomicrospira sp. R3]